MTVHTFMVFVHASVCIQNDIHLEFYKNKCIKLLVLFCSCVIFFFPFSSVFFFFSFRWGSAFPVNLLTTQLCYFFSRYKGLVTYYFHYFRIEISVCSKPSLSINSCLFCLWTYKSVKGYPFCFIVFRFCFFAYRLLSGRLWF